jgi:mRNA-degrading endonuclease RelE of RelBE toxin-antitoxin system
MFTFDLTDELRRKIEVILRKDKLLAEAFRRKVAEVINRDEKTINAYKNLRSPLNEYKRIHLTSNYVLLFAVSKNHIVFVDIAHIDKVYRN